MRKRGLNGIWAGILLPVLAVAILLCFQSSISNLSRGHAGEDQQRLKEVLRRAAVACYAAEGVYPPDVEYLEEHYGVQIDWEHYAVNYIPIAENLMPDITVLRR